MFFSLKGNTQIRVLLLLLISAIKGLGWGVVPRSSKMEAFHGGFIDRLGAPRGFPLIGATKKNRVPYFPLPIPSMGRLYIYLRLVEFCDKCR